MLGFFSKVRSGLDSTKNRLTSILKNVFQGRNLDQHSIDEIEALLYGADMGVETTEVIISAIRNAYKNNSDLGEQNIRSICHDVLVNVLDGAERSAEGLFFGEERFGKDSENSGNGTVEKIPIAICLVGANGSGKTTTTAKLASFFASKGKSVLVGACDTFRAAANEQIKIWAKQLGFDLVESHRGADSASVAFDTCQAAINRRKDVVILDTAGRLHNRENLMAELVKLKRVTGKVHIHFPQHTWLVIDGNLGVNSIVSAQKFHEELGLNGIIVTKLDGTGRGGAIVGIYRQFGLPIYFIGT
ncbi:MAG: signal recognition particle-docking protein FtsY, partial [Puniceicoccales bacterium]|nr:signal recognition particle-docking protein FtsY [Puniceicoccales bacterium]